MRRAQCGHVECIEGFIRYLGRGSETTRSILDRYSRVNPKQSSEGLSEGGAEL